MAKRTMALRRSWSLITVLAASLFLSACVYDGAAMQIEGKEHSISVTRDQRWIWNQSVDLYAVATRMPKCQRRHKMASATIKTSQVEVFDGGGYTFYLRQGSRWYELETETCEGFKRLDEEPKDGPGPRLGVFREKGGEYVFEVDPAARPDAPAKAAS